MTVDIAKEIERDERAMERVARALERLATVEEKRFKADHPEPKRKRQAVITRPSDEKREQFSDRAEPEWIAETEETVSRFQQRFESSKIGSTPTQTASPAPDEGKP